MNIYEKSIKLHKEHQGKIKIVDKINVANKEDLSLVYSPGVSGPCKEIVANPESIDSYTARGNQIAVITDGTAVLGLGNIGPRAALPVIEGKALLFYKFANISAFPICLDTTDTDEIIETIARISPVFSGINLEDISSPRCFEIEERLQEMLDIPIFHDDQHGTAIVVLAGITNALKLAGKSISDIKIVLNGPGAAGTAIAYLLRAAGVNNILVCDEHGILSTKRKERMDFHKYKLAQKTNPTNIVGDLETAIVGADVFIGVSVPNCLTQKMVNKMQKQPIVFALSNPSPEISYEDAKEANVFIYATGRSDYPNQINNLLAFPGIFRGLLDSKAKTVTPEMKINAAVAIANLVSEEELSYDRIIPDPFDDRVVSEVANAIINTLSTN